jgi:hypothetical protein
MTSNGSGSEPTKDIVFEGRIDPRARTVTFQLADGVIDPPEVHLGENVRWDLSGVPVGWRARIRFVRFPDASEPMLLAYGNSLEGESTIDGGVVQRAAPDGPYAYLMELVDGKGSVTRLDVVTRFGEATTRAEEGRLTKRELVQTGGVEGGNPGGLPKPPPPPPS